jgi:hypothetical protein
MDIVTVVFGEELPLLALQARSLARFLDSAAVGRLLVVVNDFHEDACVAAAEALRPHYGPLAGRLEVIRPDALRSDRRRSARQRAELWYVKHGRGPLMRRLPRRERLASGWRGNPGWSMQQAQKLLAVNAASAPYVLILDAKNFFVAPAGLDTFVAADGRARSRRVPLGELQRKWVQASFRKLGLAAPDIAEAPPTVTPVALERGLMREGVDAIEDRLGPLESFFSLWKGRATEFMLLFAAIDRGLGRWWDRFADGLPEAATVYNKGDDLAVREAIARAGAEGSPLMGLHRRAMRRIDDETGAALAGFWLDLGLFKSVDDARAVMAEARS